MDLPVAPPIEPMLARLAREIPAGEWCYEPKWDGFRCLAFVDRDEVVLQSRNLRPLTRYFPEVVDALRRLDIRAVLDGEILLEAGDDFPALLERIHPAASRVQLLAQERPARYVAFDCLADGVGELLRSPFVERRQRLEQLVSGDVQHVALTALTRDVEEARRWFAAPAAGWDGVVAKRLGSTYEPGKRAMVKVKQERTADCVVAGVRPGASGVVSSLLLGLWTDDGRLHHPGVVSSPPKPVKEELAAQLPNLAVDLDAHPWRSGFGLEGGATGRLKGAGGRWLPGMTQDWIPVRPVVVAEVAYDRVDGLRFRHPARFRRWRPDRDPSTCRLDQLVTGR